MSSCAGMSPKCRASPLLDVDVHPGRDLLELRGQRDVAVQTHLVAEDQRLPVVGEQEAEQGERGAANRDVGVDGRVARPHVDALAVDAQTERPGAGDVEIDDLARQPGHGVACFGVELERTLEQSPEQAERRCARGHSRSPR